MVGFMVTAPRYKPVHDNAFVKTYALLEEMGLPLSFHAAYCWNDQSLQLQNRFLGVHALGFMWFNMVHMTNWVINAHARALPQAQDDVDRERPDLGLLPGAAARPLLQDAHVGGAGPEAPAVASTCSEMFYSTQPMEMPDDKSILEATFKMINAKTQLCWASDYPHWDFDLPSDDLRSAVPRRAGQAQHPRRQRRALLRQEAADAEEDPESG